MNGRNDRFGFILRRVEDILAVTILFFAAAISFLTILLLSREVSADELYLGGWSKHLGRGEFNETHNMILYRRGEYTAGYFLNSEAKDSFLVGKRYGGVDGEYYEFNANIAFIYGYERCVVCPVIMPELVYTRYKIQPVVSMLDKAVIFGLRVEI